MSQQYTGLARQVQDLEKILKGKQLEIQKIENHHSSHREDLERLRLEGTNLDLKLQKLQQDKVASDKVREALQVKMQDLEVQLAAAASDIAVFSCSSPSHPFFFFFLPFFFFHFSFIFLYVAHI